MPCQRITTITAPRAVEITSFTAALAVAWLAHRHGHDPSALGSMVGYLAARFGSGLT
jgi:hypothetical protein